jgi:hypothetical protein
MKLKVRTVSRPRKIVTSARTGPAGLTGRDGEVVIGAERAHGIRQPVVGLIFSKPPQRVRLRLRSLRLLDGLDERLEVVPLRFDCDRVGRAVHLLRGSVVVVVVVVVRSWRQPATAVTPAATTTQIVRFMGTILLSHRRGAGRAKCGYNCRPRPAMAQTKSQIQSLLAGANTQPRHRFGQNFMIDQNLVRVIADAANLTGGDVVVEVGPGTGTLTEEILSRGVDLVAVEIDRDLAKLLRERFADQPHFTLIEGDALSSKHEINVQLVEEIRSRAASGSVIKLVANLPYNIASPLIIELLILGIDQLVFTVQKEVADRLRAAAGSTRTARSR